MGGNDKFDLVLRGEVFNVLPTYAIRFTAAGAFEIHDAVAAWIEFLDVMRATCFGQYGISQVTQPGYECWTFFLKQRFTAGQLDQWQCLTLLSFLFEWLCHVLNGSENVIDRHGLAALESIGGVAVGTTQVTTGQPNEHTGQPGEGAFALYAQIDFVDQ